MICAGLLVWLGRTQVYAAGGPSETGTVVRRAGRELGRQWYRTIVEHGYPQHLPTLHGVVQENSWAFYPLYPSLVRLVMWTGLPYATAASFVSLVCGAGGDDPAVPDARTDGWAASARR